MVDLNRLRVFRAVIASGSVAGAAANLGYTPSAVSQHIAALSRETGLTLFEKAGRGIVPTAAARVLAENSEDMMVELSRLDDLVSDLRDGRTGSLTIGSFASAGESWLPTVARQLQADHPQVQVTITLSSDVLPRGARADLDISTELPGNAAEFKKDYRRTVLTEDAYLAVLPQNHPLAALDSIPLAQFKDERWILEAPDDDVCSVIIRDATRAAGFLPRAAVHTIDHHASIAFVAAGTGIAVLPRLAIGNLPTGLVSREIVDPTPRRRIVAHLHDRASSNPAAVRALEILVDISRRGDSPLGSDRPANQQVSA